MINSKTLTKRKLQRELV